MSTLSVFCFIKNEERLLAEALLSIRPCADELIVIDTGSTDRSVEIASSIADRVVEWGWRNDFARASNFGASLCNSNYLAKWDGDWVLRSGDQEKLNVAKYNNFNNKCLVELAWINEFDDNLIPHMLNKKQFIYDKNKFYWTGQAHDYLVPIETSLKTNYNWLDSHVIGEMQSKNQDIESLMDIWVYHHKEKQTLLSDRRTQTKQLIDSELKTAKGDEYLRLIFFAVSNTLYNEQYSEAQNYLNLLNTDQKDLLWALDFQGLLYLYTTQFELLKNLLDNLTSSTPQLQLLRADYLALHNQTQAIRAYQQFIETHHYTRSTVNLNFKRMIDHPINMIKILSK